MSYSVKELREKMVEKISDLGVDSKFRENPAYASAIAEIDSLISQMNMSEAAEVVTVMEEEGKISFEWVSPVGEKYSMDIFCPKPETLKCITTEEKKPFVGTNGQLIRQKSAIEKVATLDNSGRVTLETSGSMIDNIDCEMGKCNNSTWAEKKSYSQNGLMTEKEYKGFARGELSQNYERIDVSSMLYIPRRAFDIGNDMYETRTLLVKQKLDTARIVSEDKKKGIKYNASTLLDQEHGLREMVLPGGYEPYRQEVVITPLSQDQIEAMIQKESNPKVADELRKYAEGRENYYYNSIDDQLFVCELESQSQEKAI